VFEKQKDTPEYKGLLEEKNLVEEENKVG